MLMRNTVLDSESALIMSATSPSLSPELLSLLVCPETNQPLSLAGAEECQEWEAPVECEAILITSDSTRAYPVIEGLPRLVAAEALRRKGN